jgi:hypothetical protein
MYQVILVKKVFLVVKWVVLALLAPFAVGYFLLTVVTFVLGDPQAMVDFPILLSAIVLVIIFRRWYRLVRRS